MSQENVEIVRRAYEAFNQGDLEGLLGFVDPEIEVRPDPDLPVEKLVGAADRVMAITRETATKQDTGIEVDQRVHHVWTLRDRRAVRWEVFYDPTRALEAAGLSG